MVEYLHECGFETRLRKNPSSKLDADANAGLENYPLPENIGKLPYVIKSPWIIFDPDLALSHEGLSIDAVIIPMRSLNDAASSRVTIERVAAHKKHPWMKTLSRSWEHWAQTPGGMVVPFNVEDEKRVLAVGFHDLVQYCVTKDIPFVFLDYPRFIYDAEYLFHSLSNVIDLEYEIAIRAQKKLADPSRVRSGRELGGEAPQSNDLEFAALKRLLLQSRNELKIYQEEINRMREELSAANRSSEHARRYPWKYLLEAWKARVRGS
ncbi:hypothetical protein [Lutimaribacter saemankumensis]|uniref:hypothetical protein n=1 Tax=Lutimaribacter saemankumensis TaxID=490829 RepID=UPI0011143FF1|nr:hypothetical protein [Lutimaribacter saemankumensis]